LTSSFAFLLNVKCSSIQTPKYLYDYINDLAVRINSLNCGVPFDDFCLSLLLYAEDIALIAPDENSLQFRELIRSAKSFM
jgi:hypothetical protein